MPQFAGECCEQMDATLAQPRLVEVPQPRLRVVDVALFYGERTGGIRTYLDAKAEYAAASGAFEHHAVIPGRRELDNGTRPELRALTVAAAHGYGLRRRPRRRAAAGCRSAPATSRTLSGSSSPT